METAKIGIVGVVGSGTMGSGIAQVFAQAGYLVHLSDVRQDLLERALKTIEKSLDRFVQKGSLTVPDRNSTLSRISPAPGLSAFSTCGLAVEAVKRISRSSGPSCRSWMLFASTMPSWLPTPRQSPLPNWLLQPRDRIDSSGCTS